MLVVGKQSEAITKYYYLALGKHGMNQELVNSVLPVSPLPEGGIFADWQFMLPALVVTIFILLLMLLENIKSKNKEVSSIVLYFYQNTVHKYDLHDFVFAQYTSLRYIIFLLKYYATIVIVYFCIHKYLVTIMLVVVSIAIAKSLYIFIDTALVTSQETIIFLFPFRPKLLQNEKIFADSYIRFSRFDAQFPEIRIFYGKRKYFIPKIKNMKEVAKYCPQLDVWR